MSGIEKILVHVDTQADNGMLLEKVARIAKSCGARTELYSPCYNRAIKQGYLFDNKAEQSAEHRYLKQIEARLEELARPLLKRGLEVTTDVTWNSHRVEAILKQIARYQPDLVVHGIAEHHTLGHLVSSCDWDMMRECPVPLLLLKGRSWGEALHLSACIDPFHECDEPVSLDEAIVSETRIFATALAGRCSYIHSLHTLPHSAVFDEHVIADYGALQHRVREQHRDRVASFLQRFDIDTGAGQLHMLEGETHKTLPIFASEQQVDILVVGSVPKGFIDRLLLGSTIERIADDLVCDMLVVKPPGFTSPVSDI
ncbi:universal stress protein [Marinobacterium jannaschii]|uniref:universal stress protein n=1 Tax=Marinobacterium jannaschii TaxID=64970 RepID=UPI000A018AE7|nr:universal stress protein [Marinobacterium jannaschii]